MSSRALPLLGLGVGAAISTIGASGLAALLWGASDLSKRDRLTIGATMGFFIGGGAMLTALSQMQLRELAP